MAGEGSSRKLVDYISVGILTRVIPREIVDDVLVRTERREQRKRLLPAHVVVYYVLALALFCGDGYEEVIRKLVGGLRFLRNWSDKWSIPTTSAISQARVRLGEEPMRELFERVAVPLARPGTLGSWYRRHRVMAIDGVVLDMPDTPENNAEYVHSSGGRGAGAFPVARVVGLGECGTHAIVAATIGSWSTGERTLAPSLLEAVDESMIVLADRGFYSYELWLAGLDTGAALLFRASSNLVLPVIEALPDGSYRSVLLPPRRQSPIRKLAKRRGSGTHGDLTVLAERGTACRVIEYSITAPSTGQSQGETETIRLITSLADHQTSPAVELAALYHQRWEFELSLREIEMYQMSGSRVLRSKSPAMVRQEIWGMLIAHYAIRHLMHEVAETAGVDPDRLSFLRSLRLVRRSVADQAGFSP